MQTLPLNQRHALLLNAVVGFGVDEIAQIQERGHNEVNCDIDQARDTLRRWLTADVDSNNAKSASGSVLQNRTKVT